MFKANKRKCSSIKLQTTSGLSFPEVLWMIEVRNWLGTWKRKQVKTTTFSTINFGCGNLWATNCCRLGNKSWVGSIVRWSFGPTQLTDAYTFIFFTISCLSNISESCFHLTHDNMPTVIYFPAFYLRASTWWFSSSYSESWGKRIVYI